MNKLMLVLTLAASSLFASLAPAQAQAQALILGISEGTSGGLDHAMVRIKYKGLSEALSRALKTEVNVVFVREFKQLEEGMKTGRLDFVMARPSDYPARGMRDYGYRYIASAKPDGQCFIIVPKDSPLKTLQEIKGKKIAMPEKVSYMSRFCTAELKDKGIRLENENVQYVREQAAVGFYLKNTFAQVGAIASYSGLAKSWEKDGGRILHKSRLQPYAPLIAHKKITPAQIKAIQGELEAMPDTEAGKDTLKRIGITQFDTTSEQRTRELLQWLDL